VQRPEFPAFLASALAALAREVPAAYQGVTAALDGVALRVEIGRSPCVLRFASGAHRFAAADERADAEVASDPGTLLDLIDARISLPTALREDRLWLRGPLETLVRFDRALALFFAGALRGKSFPALLEDLRLRGGTSRETP
jgi:SCP-2 sterol transfer family